MYDIIVFENLRFRRSTRKWEAGVFLNLHSEVRFCKVTFSVTVFTGYVWTVGQIGNKNLRFQKRKKRIRLDGALVHLVDCANRWNIFYGIWVVIKTTFTLLSGVLFSHLCLPSETEGRVWTLSLVLTNLRFISNQAGLIWKHPFRLCSDGFS